MRDQRYLLKPSYDTSRALIIGINNYEKVSPLGYAVSDATAVRDILIGSFAFQSRNVTLLSDENATKANILKAFMTFASDDVGIDDRIVIFFAGHGHTISGSRGEIGFLIPYDADTKDLSSMIRWDDLTRGAELIRAKHVLFVMDACYSGLALTRNVHAGSTRFLKDMLLRFSRQVVTAGKADEVVADSGGPLPNHSIFTGHLLEGLSGKAATSSGVITASGLMAYVYQKVAIDQNSDQTPHYGTIEGDGDFIFHAPQIEELTADSSKDLDTLLVIPFVETETRALTIDDKISQVKSFLSDDSSTILLHDLVSQELREFLSSTNDDLFSPAGNFDLASFAGKLEDYENVTFGLAQFCACIAYWAKPIHQPILQKILTRSTDRFVDHSGNSLLLNLRWYPIILELYSAGIAAVAGQRYDSLSRILSIEGDNYDPHHRSYNLLEVLTGHLIELISSKVFNKLPGYERRHTPINDYIFKLLQPRLDDALFLGNSYERSFNEFEFLLGLYVAHKNRLNGNQTWGPIGRFGWNHRAFQSLKAAALEQGENWEPWRSGMFKGRHEDLLQTLSDYGGLISRLNWY